MARWGLGGGLTGGLREDILWVFVTGVGGRLFNGMVWGWSRATYFGKMSGFSAGATNFLFCGTCICVRKGAAAVTTIGGAWRAFVFGTLRIITVVAPLVWTPWGGGGGGLCNWNACHLVCFFAYHDKIYCAL